MSDLVQAVRGLQARRLGGGGRSTRTVGTAEITAAVLLAALAGAVAAGYFSSYLLTITFVLAYAVVCVGLVLLFGVAGQLTLGQAIFMGAGAVVAGDISGKTGFGLEIEIPLAFLIGFVMGVVIGLPALRVDGLYLAIATYALSFAGQQVMAEWKPVTGGAAGMASGPLRIFGANLGTQTDLVYVGVVLLAISLWIARNLMRGRTGRAWHALRTSESAAASVSAVRVGYKKVVVFALSGALGAVGGVLYMHAVTFMSPSNFGVSLSILLVLTVIIGGAYRLVGSVVGAIFVLGIPDLLRSVQPYQGMIYGAVLFVIILFAPRGLVYIGERAWAELKSRRAGFGDGGARTSLAPAPGGAGSSSNGSGVEDLGGSPTLGWPSGEELAPVSGPAPQSAGSAPSGSTTSGTLGLATAPTPFSQALVGRATAGGPVQRACILELADLEVEFGGVVAVSGISLALEKGGVVGLIGPNGAGKTSVFNALSGLVRSSGTITLDGVALHALSPRRRALCGLGRTFQNLNLHPDRTVREHLLVAMDRFMGYGMITEAVRTPGVVRAERRARADAETLLEEMGLAPVADRPVESLAYGLQKRVDVARALATRPTVLLLDEPAAGLPTVEASELIARVLRVARREEMSVVIIEHNVELVAEVAERVVVLVAGTIVADGPPEAALREEAVIAAYLGE